MKTKLFLSLLLLTASVAPGALAGNAEKEILASRSEVAGSQEEDTGALRS